MDYITGIFKTSLGRKYLMAITGAGLFGFIIAHLLGNLLMFAGPAAINEYAAKLHALGPLLWVARIGLLGMVGLHIWSAIQLTSENREARGVQYESEVEPVDAHRRDDIVAKFAARTMIFSGLIIAAFAFYHLAHYTWKVPQINGAGADFETFYVADDLETQTEGQEGKDPVDVYRMVVTGFKVPWVTGFYVVAIGLLCLHLSHGLSAMFQSLGLKNKNYGKWIDCGAKAASALIFLGYISIPVSVLAGFIK
ncbi:MAG: succinate dehydrogenase cytochrome b subunit [Verrucomicrobia subdivision 3 bacterium]|nr:succinate dehydrogenase cytochrome b subunit [Limisphaerales bacterium]